MPARRMPREADGPRHRQIEAAGEDHRALAEGEDGEETGQHDQRIPVAQIEQWRCRARTGSRSRRGRSRHRRAAHSAAISAWRVQKDGMAERRGRAVVAMPAVDRRRSSRPSCDGQRACAPGAEPRRGACGVASPEANCAEIEPASTARMQNRALGDGRIIGRDIEHEQDVDDDHQDIGAE